MKCQKPSPDCYDMIKQSLEEATERSTTVTSSKSVGRRSSTMLRNGYLETGYINSGKRRRSEEKIQYCVNPNSSNQFLYLQAIQGHSGDSAVDPALQDNALLPKGFTQYIYHVGNASKLKPTTRRGSIPGGTSLKRGRQAVFFAWGKLHALLQNQGSRHARILGNAFKIRYFGAI